MPKTTPKGWEKTHKVQIMVTEEQKVSWERAAYGAGYRVSEWLRWLGDKDSGFRLPVPDDISGDTKEEKLPVSNSGTDGQILAQGPNGETGWRDMTDLERLAAHPRQGQDSPF